VLHRAKVAVTQHARNAELLSLDQLARELGVHQRTLRAAARTGRGFVAGHIVDGHERRRCDVVPVCGRANLVTLLQTDWM
jgi:hypothetical protein